MKSAHTYHFPIVVEKDRSGYYAACPALQGCYSQGETYEKVLENIEDAIRLHVEDRIAESEEIGEPRDIILSSVEISVAS
ncbi:hypothetical protein A2853_00415 [Candidatus Kaiserbacteria bacterium RIFCSPHIGHO2_01_FULL_55_17]|uniref:HicB-like antitoxin of toxin-antitoxin system domain-containing protein n=1 Tax=Candidatus Kaiserbacteria bacterium RIFCSPHIGHO2_01_FULL_55_17 TaxID=1798484 RepID=A0A1F6D856_9BACT|nr:MAG: hypothetical protein A2853_00415 [Candidatus Kaiserbacteria bacterium RIFCSPHIGHO2_01_FULL_55_17]